MASFAATGTATTLGKLVVDGLGGEGAVTALTANRPAELDGAACLLSLAVGPCPSPEPGGTTARLGALRRALAAAEAAGVTRVVHLSSAVVYGAAAENAVPLAEDAPVRPDPGHDWAVELAEAERLVAEWRDGGPDRAAAVLRPALVVAEGEDGAAKALGGLTGLRTNGPGRPIQLVHLEDVAAAVVTCATAGEPIDGPLNVAPDDWVGDDEVAALAGAALPPPAIPAPLLDPVRRVLWTLRIGATAPPAAAYATHPWVVAADRLRSLGWAPTHTAEEALVATTSCSALAALPPRRRQALLLTVTAALLGASALTLLAAVSRAVRGLRR